MTIGAERLQSVIGSDRWQELNLDFDLQLVNGQSFFVDTKSAPLADGESRVYPYFDEAADLYSIAASLDEHFDNIVDAVAGGGHSMLPILRDGIAVQGYGIDLNPRAVNLASVNAAINGLDKVSTFVQGDIHDGLPRFEGKTLYMANAPFALTAGEPHDVMRDGGADGLKISRVFIRQAVDKADLLADLESEDRKDAPYSRINVEGHLAFVAGALMGAKPGDVVIGVAYTRIGTDGHAELASELEKYVRGKGAYEIKLLEGRKIWRGANGKKEQPNPMDLNMMFVKAIPGSNYARQVAEYRVAAEQHLKEGFDRLGYFAFVIRVGATA